MNPKLAEVIAALPPEEGAEHTVRAALETELEGLAAKLARRPVPIHPFRRLWALGGLEAHLALAYAAWWVRGWFEGAAEHERRLMETNLRAGLRMLRSMTYLRGAVMKLGQALGSLPDIVPDAFIETLGRLHFQAPPMHFSLLREMVRNELGGEPEEIFADFEPEAFAAASLGQVHRARLKTGERVAVKIQYPGIARAIESDFRTLSALLAPLRFTRDWENTKEQFEYVQRMLRLEVDYVQEAEFQRRAAKLFAPEDGVVVPRVYDDYSTSRVLTTEYLDGVHIQDFLASNPALELREAFGERMYRASYRMYYAGTNYADPHPGNFVFLSDGRLGLLDFGCMWAFTDADWVFLRNADACVEGGEEAFRRHTQSYCNLTEEDFRNEEYIGLIRTVCDWTLAPLREKGAFDFSDAAQLRRGLQVWSDVLLRRYTRGQPMSPYLIRMLIGLRALLYRLRARVPARTIWQEELARAGRG